MQDRFKFRVWDVQNKKYIYFNLLNSESINDFAFFADDDAPDYNEQIKCKDTNCWALIMEQCTGLKDKHGNLIYEGDIVKLQCNREDRGGLFYQNAEVIYDITDNCSEFCLVLPNGEKASFWRSHKMEIIGNIHEKHELLELKND